MALPTTFSNGIKVYNLTAEKAVPQWQADSKGPRKKLSAEFKRRIELLQNFEFPSACSKICVSADGTYLLATGTYKPMVKAFELSQLSLKFERHLDSTTEDFVVLSEDYSKMCFLRSDKVLEFHTQTGSFFKAQIPSNEVYRMNLDEGRFKTSLETGFGQLNHGAFNSAHRFYAFCGDSGKIQCFDERTRDLATELNVREEISLVDGFRDSGEETVTRIAFDSHKNKLLMAAGTEGGKVALFDLRMKRPLSVVEHKNETAVLDVDFHESGKIVSADSKAIKIWDIDKIFTTLMPTSNVNSLCLYPHSGVVFAACDEQRAQAFFVPALGVAPKWCAFLDSITEELEEEKNDSVYEDFKFVTCADLKELDAEDLMNTNKLKPFMHGYLMNYRHYSKLKATVSKPELDEFLRNARRDRIEKKLSERINTQRKQYKINNSLAEKLAKNKKSESILSDDRFSRMFEEPDFNIDIRSDEYKLRHSTLGRKFSKGEK